MNIREIDLNRLSLFLAIAEEQNLTRASVRTRLSQPALSHALKRLRADFNDPLFVRGSRGLVPTERALALLPRVRELLERAQALYRPHGTASFATVTRGFTLGATTYFELRALEGLMRRLADVAPRVVLETRALSGDFPKGELERGEMDVAVAAYFDQIPESFRVRVLGRDPFVCVARKGHPYLRSRRTLADYLKHGHARIAVPAQRVSRIDQELKAKGRSRRILCHIGNFLTPPIVVAGSDLLLTCPASLAENYARHFPVEIARVPVRLEPLEVRMVWHERTQADPFQKWMRERIAEGMA